MVLIKVAFGWRVKTRFFSHFYPFKSQKKKSTSENTSSILSIIALCKKISTSFREMRAKTKQTPTTCCIGNIRVALHSGRLFQPWLLIVLRGRTDRRRQWRRYIRYSKSPNDYRASSRVDDLL